MDLNVADLLTKAFDGPRYYLELERMVQAQLGHEKGHPSSQSSGFLFKPTERAGDTDDVDFLRSSKLRYALTNNPPIYDSLVKQFWQTATARTLADGTQQLNATIDSIEYTITEEFWFYKILGQPQPSAAPTPSQPVPTPSPSHVQITPPSLSQPPPTLTQPVQSTSPPPQPSSVQPTSSPPPIQPVQTTSSPPITAIPDTIKLSPSPQFPSPSIS
ncbi:hypothetical protein Tco_0585951 [Tanacetum coccineum]